MNKYQEIMNALETEYKVAWMHLNNPLKVKANELEGWRGRTTGVFQVLEYVLGVNTAMRIVEKWKAEVREMKYIELKNKRVQLLLQPSTVKALKELAEEKGMSMNEAANQAIKQFLKSNNE